MMGLTTPAATAAPGDTWFSSFESGDTTPLVDTEYAASPRENVTGVSYAPGLIDPAIITATASNQINAGEGAPKAADADPTSKWLMTTTSGWLRFELDTPKVVKKYVMVTANDEPTRNPKNWIVQGSQDGTNWTDLDTQTDQLPSTLAAFTRVTYETLADNTTAYKYYRLNISANQGNSLTQLADWELYEDPSGGTVSTPMNVEVTSGPGSSRTAKLNAGWTGVQALRYRGSHVADGDASATNVVYDDLDLLIGEDTELSYKIMPQLIDTDLTYPATFAAVDLELSDGTTTSLASEANLVDSYGFDFNARAYGEEKALYGSQWNNVQVDLSSLEGKRIKKILITYDNPTGEEGTQFTGWVDDISIAPAEPIDDSSLLNYVDTRRGSNGTQSFSRGLTAPLSAVPNGFNFLLPYTNAESQTVPYSYHRDNNSQNRPALEGIGVSHITSPWMGDRNQFAVTPYGSSGTITGSRSDKARSFSHDNEIAQPHYYGVDLDNGMKVEGTPTDHGGIFRFTANPGESSLRVLVDKVSGDGSFTLTGSDVTGWVDGGSGLSVGRTRMFIAATFSKTPTGNGAASSRSGSVYGTFPVTDEDNEVELRWATSFISLEQAQKNLAREVTGKSFEEVKDAAGQEWLDRLSVIDLSQSETATDAQKLQIYSDLYRLNLYPNSQFEDVSALGSNTPEYKYASPVAATEGTATATTTNAQVKEGKIYVNNGFWDTYRTAWPLYSFLYPDIANELVDGFVQQYRDSGWISRWSSPGYADLMTGTSSDVAFAEAYTSGALSTEVAEEAYAAGWKNAMVLPSGNTPTGTSSNQVGRKGLDRSIFLGYITSSQNQSTSWGMEGYINDYGLGMMAKKLSEDPDVSLKSQQRYAEESEYLLDRAKNYVEQFDPNTEFFQGRNADGTWELSPSAYDPMNWGNHTYTETNGWNFAFHVPFDVDGLAALYGGSEGLKDKLIEFFTTPEPSMTSSIHEAYEQRDVRIGTFGMSNQVAHHIAYIGAAGGSPSVTQEIVREVLQRLFVGSEIGQGFPGDEDNGEFSSWHLFSSLGFYPLALGSGEYTIGSPLFDKVIVKRGADHGGDLVITADNNSRDNIYVAGVDLDGQALDSVQLNQADLRAANSLHFEMAATPQTWGERTTNESPRVPLYDVSGSKYSTLNVTGLSSVSNLRDDNSTTVAQLPNQESTLTYELDSDNVKVETYTITNGGAGTVRPTDWVLEASHDGQEWTELDSQENFTFDWNTYTVPFQIDEPDTYKYYRLNITKTTSGEGATLAEFELLASADFDETLSIKPTSSNAVLNVATTNTVAEITGGSSNNASDYTATVNYGDGDKPAEVVRAGLGGLAVQAELTMAQTGMRDITVSVTNDGETKQVTSTVLVERRETLESQFNNACLSVEGVGANCDGLGYAYDKAQLALEANGALKQGVEKTVPGTSLKFTLPVIESGEPDNILGEGQTFKMNLSQDATQYSFIGMGNEGAQSGIGMVYYDDNTSEAVQIEFGDWVGAATNPQSGNIVVGLMQTRLAGTGKESSNKTTALFSTAPISIPAGKKPVSFELPNKSGSLNSGKMHIFAVADNGDQTTRATAVSAEQPDTPITSVPAEQNVDFDLAKAVGGFGTVSATVHWGDGTGTQNATVTDGVVSASHEFVEPGTYTITVVLDDGAATSVIRHTVTVTGAQVPTVSLAASPQNPTTFDEVTLTAAVDADATGTVTFVDEDNQEVGSAQVTAGVAEVVVGPLAAGTYQYKANYSGDEHYASGSADTTITVVKATPTVTLSADTADVTEGTEVTLTAGVPSDATGSVTFLEGTDTLATETIADGLAVAKVTLPAGSHTITARYDGDDRYGTQTSPELTITVRAKGTDPVKPTPGVALSAPSFSKVKQPFKAKGAARRYVASVATGLPVGTVVTFKSGNTVLGSAKVAKSGKALVASLKIKGKLKLGTYANVTASAVVSGKTVASPASKQVFKVVKAKTKKVTVKTKKIAAGIKAKIKVKIAKLSNGRYASGKVQILVGKKVIGSKSFKAKAKGKVTVTLRRAQNKNVKVRAKFVPNKKVKAGVKAKASKKTLIRVVR